MPMPKDKFLAEVLSHIKFPFDRRDIRSELEQHIADKTNHYLEKGYDRENAEERAVNEMGDAREIGIELNKEHNPLLGWVWKISNVLVPLVLIPFILFIFLPMMLTTFSGVQSVPKELIAYQVNVNEKVRIDDRVIHFTQLIYDKNGSMHIYYNDYETRLAFGWSLGEIGEVTDNLGNRYFEGGGTSQNGFISKSRRTLRNFSPKADTLFIEYDQFNRSYTVEIPLPAGDGHE
ncbi:permease prefix domain 1-containing protein [Dethiobacter alkaliphilus]|uniref:permease prefix domain 1-containing protein n=1 Tax=Dethiobacter alkaliphilus TaxID=427926 RepID=UPI0022273C2D|nr:permease prefix domain 1-containing protein [Dethiobacter alkaliphilus]MCW3488934.1 permease prefix domain 1-containing protein [Dethiobacter alkaliphilus]